MRSVPLTRPLPDISVSASTKGLTSTSNGSYFATSLTDSRSEAKQRTKKITVACNFCRCEAAFSPSLASLTKILTARKLKCDGGRPACSQCVKRSNSCDYMPQSKRRGGLRTSRDRDSGSDSADEPSPDALDTPVSEVPSLSLSRRTSNAGSMTPLPSIGVSTDASTSSIRSKGSMSESRSYWADNELPRIATLSLPEHSPSTPVPMSAPPLPPIRPASEHQAAQRKRAATAPGKSGRQPSTSGPKVVACNFCRGSLARNLIYPTASHRVFFICSSPEDEVRRSTSCMFQLCPTELVVQLC